MSYPQQSEGRDTIKPYYQDYTKYMWRCYLTHQNINPADMTDLNRKNMTVCAAIAPALKPTERDIILAFATSEGNETVAMREYSSRNNVSEYYAWSLIRRVMRLTAQKRGLWENEKTGTGGQE